MDEFHVYQGVEDKTACLQNVPSKLNIPLEKIACIGDDENDLPIIRICGIKECPTNVINKVTEIVYYVCVANGGSRAVREFAEWLTGI